MEIKKEKFNISSQRGGIRDVESRTGALWGGPHTSKILLLQKAYYYTLAKPFKGHSSFLFTPDLSFLSSVKSEWQSIQSVAAEGRELTVILMWLPFHSRAPPGRDR